MSHTEQSTVKTKKENSVAGFSMTKQICRVEKEKKKATPATRSTMGSIGGNSNLAKAPEDKSEMPRRRSSATHTAQ